MRGMERLLAGMGEEPRDSGEHPGQGKADHDPHQDSQVEIDVVAFDRHRLAPLEPSSASL